MICKYCKKSYNITESWNSDKFCSKKCRAKYNNISKMEAAKNSKIDKFKLLSINPKLSPRDLGGSYGTSVDILCRANPLRVFRHKGWSDDIKRHIVRRYVDNKNIVNSLVFLSKTYNTTGLMYYFLSYICIEFPHISNELKLLYNFMSTWDIARLFNLDQNTIRKIYGDKFLGVTSRSMRCSKIHLQTKPKIEKLLGYKTITEQYISGYWIDEFSPENNLCIEIDGDWCHNKEYDSIRDSKLNSLGFDVVRIPAYSSDDTIRELLSKYIKH